MTRPRFAIVVLAMSVVAGSAAAQTYPARPLTMVVGYAVGGPTDTIARIMAERMKVALGQPVIVENVTGAAGSIAGARVARAAPDGYTLGMGDWSTHVVNPAMYDLQYDVVKDFAPVALLPSAPQIILTPNSVPATNLSGADRLDQGEPGQGLATAPPDCGSPSHVSGILLQNVTGARIQLVPYRGAALVMQDMLAGRSSCRCSRRRSRCSRCAWARCAPTRSRAEARIAGRARHPDRGRGGTAGLSHFAVVGLLDAQGHARATSSPGSMPRWWRRWPIRRCASASPTRGSTFPTPRPADAGGARRLSEGRDREMVADHQGGQHQGRNRAGGAHATFDRPDSHHPRRQPAAPGRSSADDARQVARRAGRRGGARGAGARGGGRGRAQAGRHSASTWSTTASSASRASSPTCATGSAASSRSGARPNAWLRRARRSDVSRITTRRRRRHRRAPGRCRWPAPRR